VRPGAVCLFIASCATTAPLPPTARPPELPAAGARTAGIGLAEREVALFVRDETDRGPTLSSQLLAELRRRGVSCRVVTAASEPTPSWAVDLDPARRSGADYALRVSVVTRSETGTTVHHPDVATARATGVVIGPSADQAPIDFPELAVPGGLEHKDADGDEQQQDLRMEVMASLRRIHREELLAHWTASEGTLRRLGAIVAPHQGEAWPAVYHAVANRVADLVVDRLQRERE
jgi:hypothetical protein